MFLQLVVVLMMQFSVLNSVTFGMIFSFSRDIYTRDLTRNKKTALKQKVRIFAGLCMAFRI
jgi:hypothetical protein